MKCKAKDKCKNEAEYEFHGIKTCRDCLEEHINDEMMYDAIEEYIESNATKL